MWLNRGQTHQSGKMSCELNGKQVPPPPLATAPLPGRGETVTPLFCYAIYIVVVCVPHLSHPRSCIAFLLLQINHLYAFCDILPPKAVYRVSCPFFRPKRFLLVTMYGTTHAHLVHMCWPLLWGLHQMGHRQTDQHVLPLRTVGGVATTPRKGPNSGLVSEQTNTHTGFFCFAYGGGSLPLHHLVSDSAHPHYVSDPLPQSFVGSS